jgi:hypothetical protein
MLFSFNLFNTANNDDLLLSLYKKQRRILISALKLGKVIIVGLQSSFTNPDNKLKSSKIKQQQP